MSKRYQPLYEVRNAYLRHVTEHYFRLDGPRLLGYHYTSGNATTAILESDSFQLTNVRYMNDPEELRHSVDLLNDMLLLQNTDGPLRIAPALDHVREHVIPKLEERSKKQFILSLSLNRDSNDLWRSYGSDNGFAFEFDIPHLIDNFHSTGIRLWTGAEYNYRAYSVFNGRLLYDVKLQEAFIRDSMIFLTRLIEAGVPVQDPDAIQEISYVMTDMTYILYAALYNMKGAIHSKEMEYRFIIIPDNDYQSILLRHRGGRNEPYIQISGVLASLKSLWIGPNTICPDRVRELVGNLSLKRKIPVEINQAMKR